MTSSYDSAVSARCILHTLLTFNYLCAMAECNIVSRTRLIGTSTAPLRPLLASDHDQPIY